MINEVSGGNVKSKYIIVKTEGLEVPLIFSSFLSHEAVVPAGPNGILSAGYCEMNAAGKWITSGQSISLKLNSRPQDAEILNTQLGIKMPGCQTAAAAA